MRAWLPRAAAVPPRIAGPWAIVAAYIMAEVAASLVNAAATGPSGPGLRLAEEYLTPGLALLAAGLVLARDRTVLAQVAAWPGLRWILAGVLAGAALKIVGDLAVTLEAHLARTAPAGNNPLALHPQAFHGALSVGALAIAATVVAPLGEELFFRGLLFGWLRSRWRWPSAAFAAAILFAFAHASWGLLAPLALAGFGLCWLYERSGSLWPPVLAHATLNAVAVVAALVRL